MSVVQNEEHKSTHKSTRKSKKSKTYSKKHQDIIDRLRPEEVDYYVNTYIVNSMRRNGIKFEQKTNLRPFLEERGFVRFMDDDVSSHYCLCHIIHLPSWVLYYASQDGFNRLSREIGLPFNTKNSRTIPKPDEVFVLEYNHYGEKRHWVYIIEKKTQTVSGTTFKKISAADFDRYDYATSLGVPVHFIFCFNDKLMGMYNSHPTMKDYNERKGIYALNADTPDYYAMLYSTIKQNVDRTIRSFTLEQKD